jgi:predicted negative regulator of RcsB-dependent stress response
MSKFKEFVKQNKKKIIVAVVIIIVLAVFFLLGSLSAGKDINYIPV